MKRNAHLVILLVALFSIFFFATAPAFAVNLFGVQCDSAKPPNAEGCNAQKFLELIRAVIIQILKILLIVAPIMIAFGGIMIMTAAESESRVTLGKKIITAAIVGIAIGFGSYLIIEAIKIALNVEDNFLPGSQFTPIENM